MVRANGGTSVEVTAQGQVAPSMTTLDNPARIVLDLPGAALATSQSRILVDRDGIKDIRVGVNGLVPPTSRIVVDLSEPCTYDLAPRREQPHRAAPSYGRANGRYEGSGNASFGAGASRATGKSDRNRGQQCASRQTGRCFGFYFCSGRAVIQA